MTERTQGVSMNVPFNKKPTTKMANDLSPRKTMLVVVIVVGCFAVLWPKVFYPMLVGSANQHIKPSAIDKTTGCCDVISETDVKTIKIMSELCSTIIKSNEESAPPLSGREIVTQCRKAVLETCGIDISAVLQEQVRLGQSFKQILDEVRSLNGSLCLKYNFGLAPWRLGVPHRLNVKPPAASVRQERPPHLRSEMVHPAFIERGRAIPQTQQTYSPSRPPPRIVEGKPGPIPGLRPTIGGAGHVVPPPKQSTGSMGFIMPVYTIGIVIFFTYTVMKILFKKQQPEAGALYPHVDPDRNFRREVFESERSHYSAAPRLSRDVSSKLVVNAMSALLDEVDQEIEARHKASEVETQDEHLANGNAVKPQESDQPTVKIVGMEMTASCEGGKKWSRPESPVLSATPAPAEPPQPPPQEIYLEGALPPQSQLLVTDSATEAQENLSSEDPAVVLAGKMTLSVISLDSSENGTEESNSDKKHADSEARSSSNASEDFEKIGSELQLEDEIDQIIQEAKHISSEVEMAKEKLRLAGEFDEPIVKETFVAEEAEEVEGLLAEEELPSIAKEKLLLADEFDEPIVKETFVAEEAEEVEGLLAEEELPSIAKEKVLLADEFDEPVVKETFIVEEAEEVEGLLAEEDLPSNEKDTNENINDKEQEHDIDDKLELDDDKIKEGIQDETRNGDEEEIEEEIEEIEVEEEIEDIEYEDSGNEELENEARLIDITDDRDSFERVNGNGPVEESKRSTENINALNEADDEESEELSEDEDVEIEEIIEYVDDDDEEDGEDGEEVPDDESNVVNSANNHRPAI